jgi:MoaA/NifB/PqqE/SkfB family radical SAM enzyme
MAVNPLSTSNLISIPREYNYVAAFLTLACNFRCTYCINRPENVCHPRPLLSASAWIDYLNRLDLPDDLPISFQGGEPSLHPDFFEILKGIRSGIHIDILTNLSFDVERFARELSPERFKRKAPYASIRVTYHPGQSKLEDVVDKIRYLVDRGYPIGLYSIRVPGHEKLIEKVQSLVEPLGIDYRTKEYLGLNRGQAFGTYHYENAVFANTRQQVQCRTTELLIAPDGKVHRCHRDLYVGENGIGSISERHLYRPSYEFRACSKFGECNPCDLKRKTNRFQVDGHASVEILFQEQLLTV